MTFKSTCPSDGHPVQLNLSAAQKQIIVQTHNFYRSQVAMGNLTGYQSAAHMLEMVRPLNVQSTRLKNEIQSDRYGTTIWPMLPVSMHDVASWNTMRAIRPVAIRTLDRISRIPPERAHISTMIPLLNE